MSKLNHFSHEHPLVLSEEKYTYLYCCRACSCDILGLTYCCEECPYVLHKWCAELPCEFTHQLHPDHPLLLQFPNQDSQGEEEEEEEEKEISICESCKDPIESESIYHCTQCSFILHASCASLPSQIMLETDTESYPVRTKEYLIFKHFNENTPSEEIDEKAGVLRKEPDLYCCIFCAKSGTRSRYLYVVEYLGDKSKDIGSGYHIQCAMLPKILKHERHLHDLTLHPSIDKDLNYDECYCDACEQDRDPREWVYYCESCEFAAHLGCGVAGLDRPKQLILSTNPVYVKLKDESQSDIEERSSNYFVDLRREEERRKERIRILEDRNGLEELKHFDHEHPLILYDEEWNKKVCCRACREPIFGNTYICNDCKFYLHEWCAELPREIHHRLHYEHLLTLVPSGKYRCEYCQIISPGHYTFCCEKCNFGLHAVCVMLPESPIQHESHEHTLTPVCFFSRVDYWNICNACRKPCAGPVLNCELCSFYLHLVCALYPPIGKAKTHRHSLALTYSFQEDPNALEFICDACETPRIPNCWLYSCKDANCNFVAHVDCAAPKPFHNFTELGDKNYKLRFPM